MYETIGKRVSPRCWDVHVLDVGTGLVGQSYCNIRSDEASCSVFMLESDDRDVRDNRILSHCDQVLGAQVGGSPWSTLRWMNARLHASGSDASAKACFGICTASGLVRIAFAGYPCAYVAERSKHVRRLAGGGAPLGLFPDMQYPEKVCVLERGDAVMFVNESAEKLLEKRHVSALELFEAGRLGCAPVPVAIPQPATAIVVRRLDRAFRSFPARAHALAAMS